MRVLLLVAAAAAVLVSSSPAGSAQANSEPALFERRQLADTYFAEGANAGDIDHDGVPDIVYGPYWFKGPDYKVRHELYPAVAQPTERYADNFFNWVYDFNGDGWNDVLVVGYPGKPAYVYENPKSGKFDEPWPKHKVMNAVGNESPQFKNCVGDATPELICTLGGKFGYATFTPGDAFKLWDFHVISDRPAPPQYGHGLGVGDLNGDGRADLLIAAGWFEQPADLNKPWTFHEQRFSTPGGVAAGGADMFVYDVDGDGDADVITSLAAHDFGLAWYEQIRDGGKIHFKQHLIMGDQPTQNHYGVVFSELHSVGLADMDGDGLLDIVTGKTYWSHHKQSAMWDAGPVVYWFKLVRGKEGVDFLPFKIDTASGIGRQVSLVDVDGDGHPDIVVGGMLGANVLLNRIGKANLSTLKSLLPPPIDGYQPVIDWPGPKPRPQPEQVSDPGTIEAESLKVTQTSGGKTSRQVMSRFKGSWGGDAQLFWIDGRPGDQLSLELPVAAAGKYELLVALTHASDYATVQFALDGQRLGDPVNLYRADGVSRADPVLLGTAELKAGSHELTVKVTGADAAATKRYGVGIDCFVLRPPPPAGLREPPKPQSP